MYITYYSKHFIQANNMSTPNGINIEFGLWGTNNGVSANLTDLVPATFDMVEPLYHLVIKRGLLKVRRHTSSMYYDYHVPHFEKFDEILQYVEDKLY